MPDPIEKEALATYERFVALRDEIDVGKQPWSALADFFTEDAAYIDPAWGRIEGREAIREFFDESMAGLTGHGWSTPENWTMADGPPPRQPVGPDPRPAGRTERPGSCRVSRSSTTPATGCFCYSHDMLNMTHVGQTLKAMEWRPPAQFNMPPRQPNRDVSLPPAWAHLAKGAPTRA